MQVSIPGRQTSPGAAVVPPRSAAIVPGGNPPSLMSEPPGNWQTPLAQMREPQHCPPQEQSDPSYQQQRLSPVELVYSQMEPVTGRLQSAVTLQGSPAFGLKTGGDAQYPLAQYAAPQQCSSAPHRLPSYVQQLSGPS